MSTQLVRKLLRATEDVGYDAASAAAAAVESSSSKKRKRKEQKEDESNNHQPCTEEQVMDWHVQNILALDRSMAKTTSQGKSTSNSEIVAKQLDMKQRKERQRGRNVDEILTNSRSAAIQKSKFTKHEPTFNKDKYQKEQKEKSLRQIAKLLKKEEKKDKKKKKERA